MRQGSEVKVNPTGQAQALSNQESGFYEAYANFARHLRSWFIAYGIGGPTLFLTNDAAMKRLLDSGAGRVVAYLFLAGVSVQIIVAFLYKTAMWYLYRGESADGVKSHWWYKACDWLSESYCIECVGDVATFIFFAWATLKVLSTFAP